LYLVIVKGLLLLPLIGVGAVCVLVYTPVLTKWRLGECVLLYSYALR